MTKRKATHSPSVIKVAGKTPKIEPDETEDGNVSDYSFNPSESDNDNASEAGDEAGTDNLQQLLLMLHQNTQKRRTTALTSALTVYTETINTQTSTLLTSLSDKQALEEAEFLKKKERITELMTRRKELVLELQAIKKDVEQFVEKGSKEAGMDGEQVVKEFERYNEKVRKTWLGK